MKIAVEGCCHGQLDAIYDHIASLERRNSYKVDLLLICGDFQAIRNWQDLQCMSVPNKYKTLGTFHRYYSGEIPVPILTIVIGGNHEASNYFQELYHGGWIAPNMYFLGHAGCVQVGGLRIAGASGIFKQSDFGKGLYERLPYDQNSLRSIYHLREYNVRRLSLLSSPDIFLSHDWPASIEQHGDVEGLLRHKKYFKDDIARGTLGSPPLMGLLRTLKPKWWFSAHLHTRFVATVPHGTPVVPKVDNPDEIAIDDEDEEPANPDEILLSDEENEVMKPPQQVSYSETNFVALDKCLPNRRFLEIIDIPTEPIVGDLSISYDPEWLAITRAFHPLLSTQMTQKRYPPEHQAREMVTKAQKWVADSIPSMNLADTQTFTVTAQPPMPADGERINFATLQQPSLHPNPQTKAFCDLIGIENNVGV